MKKTVSVTFLWLAVAFCVCLITSNLFVPRTWQVFGLPLQLSGAIVIFPISYIINDVLTEVYGYRRSRLVIWMGFAMSFFVSVASLIVTKLPAPLYAENMSVAVAFNELFGFVPKSNLASLLAFFVGSTANAWVMSRMKVASKGKGFGWRAIISSLVGEASDSLIFFPIVFFGIMPVEGIISIVFTQVIAKTAYEVIILPLTSFIVKRVKAHEGVDTFDEGISYNPFRLSDI